MPVSDFVHLHVHSHYSLLDGTCTVGALVRRAAEQGMPAIALTDHGSLFGAFELCKQAKRVGVKPIPGIETYVAGGRYDSRSEREDRTRHHLVLLAKNRTGLRNLMKLSSEAYLRGFYYKPRIDRELLARHAEGLIGLSACIKGEVPGAILRDRPDQARELAATYRDIFAPGDFYLEVMDHRMEMERKAVVGLSEIAREMDLPVVATNDIHYMDPGDCEAQDVLVCIHSGKSYTDPKRLKFSTDQVYFKDESQMRSMFPDHPEWVLRTREVAEKVDVAFETGVYHLPRFVPEDGSTPESYLRHLCAEGLSRRYPAADARHRGRLDYEVRVIEEMGFVSYFLIVQDFINWARRQSIPVGPGRGSAAGSIVAYCLGITDLDPLRYDLIFERFLNPGRVSMPDIDVDFCQDGRDRVIDYVRGKYGEESVTQIITFGSLKAKLVVRDVGRVLGHPLSETDRLAKLVPDRIADEKGELKPATLGHTLETVPEFKAAYEGDPGVRRILDTALKLEGLARHPGTHAGGVIISDAPVTEYVPLYKGEKTGVTTQFPMDQVEELGLVKMDLLGLRTLTIIDRAVRLVREVHGVELDVLALDLEDRKTYGLFSRGETSGVFQFESEGMRSLLVQARPDRLEDLIALNALYRPGAMDHIPEFCNRKHGREAVVYFHEKARPILEETYGVIVYQEQVMRLAHELAGFNLGDADQLRKAMGKKKADLMARFERQFIEGCGATSAIPEAKAREIWILLAKFGEYGFNKSHSAAYALVAYQTGYLKANYPVEYMAALISCELADVDTAAQYVAEARGMGIQVLPPDVNESRFEFTVVGGRIRYGLGAIKGVGERAAAGIVAARDEGGRFRDLHDLTSRVDLVHCNKATLEVLIKAGALDGLGVHRAQNMAAVEGALRMGARAQADRRAGQLTLFEAFGSSVAEDAPAGALLPEVAPWDRRTLLAHEKEVLGHYVSGHPLDEHAETLSRFTTHSPGKLGPVADETPVVVGGLVRSVRPWQTKNGTMAFVSIEGRDGAVDVVVFPDDYSRLRSVVVAERAVIVRARMRRRAGRDEPSLVAEEVTPVEAALERFVARVVLEVPLPGKALTDLLALRDLLHLHPGTTPVTLVFADGVGQRAHMEVGDELRVKASDALVREAEGLLGPGVARLEYRVG
ncbi:MAG: DNA polymerase III subunit alpha [Planctomycetes bacterium]|nr:DNA polymerase III subunit alpha [Planctomycetota bacterium]